MNTKNLSFADKELMVDYMCRSMGRVVRKEHWCMQTIPQGVSVYVVHPETLEFEHAYTRDDKIDFERDPDEMVLKMLNKYGRPCRSGLVLYMHSEVLHVVLKHLKHSY